MSPDVLLFLFGVVLIAAALSLSSGGADNRLSKWKGRDIPPGSLGWPFIGETFSVLKRHPCTSIGPYMEERIHKYGKIFKTHLLGSPTIVSADLEFNNFVLRNDGKLFEANWPKSMVDLFGKTSVFTATGEKHQFLKSLIVNFLNITRMRNQFFGDVNDLIIHILDSWKENAPFPLKNEAAKVTFYLFTKNVLSLNVEDPTNCKLEMMYNSVEKGILAVPLKIPGTLYNKAWQEEHLKILIKKTHGGEPLTLTWEDYKEMEFTQSTDSAIPTRKDNYMPFGRGMHKCAAPDVAKMVISVFLHHFVLKYNWELVEPDHPTAYTFTLPNFPKGLPIKVHKRENFIFN